MNLDFFFRKIKVTEWLQILELVCNNSIFNSENWLKTLIFITLFERTLALFNKVKKHYLISWQLYKSNCNKHLRIKVTSSICYRLKMLRLCGCSNFRIAQQTKIVIIIIYYNNNYNYYYYISNNIPKWFILAASNRRCLFFYKQISTWDKIL